MKKFLLVSAVALAAAATASAQQVSTPSEGLKKVAVTRVLSANTSGLVFGDAKKSPVLRSKADGVYFTRDKGLLYQAADDEGYGYGMPFLVVPPYYNNQFYDQSTDKSKSVWYINGNDMKDYVADGVFDYGSLGFYKQYTSSSNGQLYDASYYTPSLSNGGSTYEIGINSSRYSTYGAAYMKIGGMNNYMFFDDKSGTGYGFGALADANGGAYNHLFGSGTYAGGNGTTYYAVGTREFYPAPASPLYVERIRISSLDGSATPIAAGAELSLQVYTVKTNADGTKSLGDSVIATLTASADDVTNYTSYDYSSHGYGMMYYNYIFFSNKQIDPLFDTEVTEPFALNEEFAIVISGCQQDGVNVNFMGVGECAEDSTLEGADILITADGESLYTIGYRAATSVDAAFYGCFDYVEPMDAASLSDGTEITNFNVLKVPAEGTTDGSGVTNYGLSSSTYTQAVINFDLQDADGSENYSIDGMPDWLELGASQFEVGEDDYVKYIAVGVNSCEALPEGTTGRAAVCYLEGKGYRSTTPIIILQGDASLETAGIKGVSTKANTLKNGKFYNLKGQNVNAATKGLLIKDGKKFYNK